MIKRLVASILIFLTGAFVSGVITWRLVDVNLWRTYDLLSDIQYIAQLDLQARLLSLNDDDLRCTLSKLARSSADEYSDKDLGESPRYGAPGLAPFAKEHAEEAVTRYYALDIEGYAKSCDPSEKLY